MLNNFQRASMKNNAHSDPMARIQQLYSNPFYYIVKSVFVENRPLVKFIRNYIRDLSGVFSTFSLVRISMTSFPALTLLFV